MDKTHRQNISEGVKRAWKNRQSNGYSTRSGTISRESNIKRRNAWYENHWEDYTCNCGHGPGQLELHRFTKTGEGPKHCMRPKNKAEVMASIPAYTGPAFRWPKPIMVEFRKDPLFHLKKRHNMLGSSTQEWQLYWNKVLQERANRKPVYMRNRYGKTTL